MLPSTPPSAAVENGLSALGDPNAIAVNLGASAFLYSPRIVLTTNHNNVDMDSDRIKSNVYGFPGQPVNSNGEKVNGLQILHAPGYLDRTAFSGGNVFSRKDDFAVIILEKSLPMTNVVKIASAEQISKWKQEKAEVKMVGYGIQNAEMRKLVDDHTKPPPRIDPSILTTRFLSDAEAQAILRGSLPPGGTYLDDMYFELKPGIPSVCDNDSGSGWFVEEGSTRYYLGAASSAWGIPNCGRNGIWGSSGALASASAAYRFEGLIKQAEDFVKMNPEVSSVKISADKTESFKPPKEIIKKITCVKKKLTKTVKGINPVCPKGYTDKSKIVVPAKEGKSCKPLGTISGKLTCAMFEGEMSWMEITLEKSVEGRPVSESKCYRDGIVAMGYDKQSNLIELTCSFKNSPGAFPSWS